MKVKNFLKKFDGKVYFSNYFSGKEVLEERNKNLLLKIVSSKNSHIDGSTLYISGMIFKLVK